MYASYYIYYRHPVHNPQLRSQQDAGNEVANGSGKMRDAGNEVAPGGGKMRDAGKAVGPHLLLHTR